jgi:outer membrane protein assembly factor BamB
MRLPALRSPVPGWRCLPRIGWTLGLGLVCLLLASSEISADPSRAPRGAMFHKRGMSAGPAPPLRRAWVARLEKHPVDGGSPGSPVVADGVVYASSGSELIAVRGEDGRRLWSVAPEESLRGAVPALDELGLYVPAGDGKMIALDRRDGARRWTFQAEGALDSAPVALGGRLCFGSATARTFYCLDTADGRLIWKVRTELEPDSVPAVGADTVAFWTQDPDSPRAMLLALNAATGRELWRFPHRLGAGAPTIAFPEEAVVFGGGDLHAYSLHLRDGRPLWRSRVEGPFGSWSLPGVALGDVFLADRTGHVLRLDGETGRRRWTFWGARGTMDRSSPLVAGGNVLIGSGAGEIFALNAASGRPRWAGSVRGSVLSGAADSERFYVGVESGDAGIHAYEHDASGRAPPAASGTDGSPERWIGLVVGLGLGGAILWLLRRRGAQPRSSPTSMRRSWKAAGAALWPAPSSRTSRYLSEEGER